MSTNQPHACHVLGTGTENSAPNTQFCKWLIRHVIFIESSNTADFQTTTGIRRILDNAGNVDDIIAFLIDRFLPVDEIQAQELAEEILQNPPETGYLTVSNALQWRLQYRRAIDLAGEVGGITRIV